MGAHGNHAEADGAGAGHSADVNPLLGDPLSPVDAPQSGSEEAVLLPSSADPAAREPLSPVPRTGSPADPNDGPGTLVSSPILAFPPLGKVDWDDDGASLASKALSFSDSVAFLSPNGGLGINLGPLKRGSRKGKHGMKSDLERSEIVTRCILVALALAMCVAFALIMAWALRPGPAAPAGAGRPEAPADLAALYDRHLHTRNYPWWSTRLFPSPPDSDAAGENYFYFYQNPDLFKSQIRAYGKLERRQEENPWTAPAPDDPADRWAWITLGDDNSDNWNRYHWRSDFPPSPPYFHGRHSNGPMYVDYLSLYTKLPSVSNAAFGATLDSDFTRDWATFGARQQADDAARRADSPADGDGRRFQVLRGRSRICVISAGANDYGAMLPPTNATARPKIGPAASVSNLRDSVIPHVVDTLLCRVLVVTTALAPSAGFPPNATNLDESTPAGAVNMHNALLRDALAAAQKQRPATEMVLYDAQGEDCAPFGGRETEGSCITMQYKAGDRVCTYAHRLRLWDESHLTTQCHAALADGMLRAVREHLERKYVL
ncbi:hypothetical protein DFJ74DRAFT_666629 [Hyaloraphidium curvatum]|nr:hypothetical protein DFJ74DRAFT_666629 [Hyaloraphidium curvatum]